MKPEPALVIIVVMMTLCYAAGPWFGHHRRYDDHLLCSRILVWSSSAL